MKLLRSFYIPLWERRYWNKILWKTKMWKCSVNSAYVIWKKWEIKRSSQSKEQQKKIKNVINKTNGQRELLKNKILLKVVIHQVTKKNKDLKPNFSQVLDIDNVLKQLIDTLNNNVIVDDTQIYWIIITRKLNEEDFSYFNIELYNFDKDILNKNIWDLTEKYDSLYKNKFNLPNWITPTSFNNLFSVKKINWKFRKVKTENWNMYSWFIKSWIWKQNYELEKKEKYFLILKFGIWNDKKRDLDNLFKSTIDCFSWKLFPDDKYINTLIWIKEPSQKMNESVSTILLEK